MKKVMLTLAVVAFVAAMTSCNKTCTCTTYVGGLSSTSEVELETLNADKCSDVNTVMTVEGIKSGMECE